MPLEYRLSLKDYQEANQAHYKSQRFWYFLIWGLSLLMILLGIVYTFASFITLGFIGSLIKGTFSLFIGIFFCPYFNLFQGYFITRAWRSQPSLREAMNLNITQEGLDCKAETYESKVQWQIFVKFLETKNVFMLYQAEALFNIIPKRAFNSDEEIEEFREILSAKIRKS